MIGGVTELDLLAGQGWVEVLTAGGPANLAQVDRALQQVFASLRARGVSRKDLILLAEMQAIRFHQEQRWQDVRADNRKRRRAAK